jgi:hypothetical protein
MNRLAVKCQSALSARLCLAAAAYCCFGASQAKAGCLDHVVVLGNLSPEQRSMMVRIMIGRSCGDAARGGAPVCSQCPFAPLGEGPCRGPHCSNERLPQGAPASPTPTRGIEPWTLLQHAVNLREIDFACYLHLPAESAPIERIDSIFHPPRAA